MTDIIDQLISNISISLKKKDIGQSLLYCIASLLSQAIQELTFGYLKYKVRGN